MAKQTAWRVYLRGKHVDTVFYDPSVEVEEVKRSLVNHDGYDPQIEVSREDRTKAGK